MCDMKEYVLEKLQRYSEKLQILQDAITTPPENLQVVRDARLWVLTVDRALEVLELPQRAVVEQLYIYPKRGNVKRLAEALSVSPRLIYRIRDKAIKKLMIALYVSAGS